MTAQKSGNVLIVKLGAFGNIILSLSAFAAIRKHHAGARISVLTGAPYAAWLRTFPWFDEVLVDPRPGLLDFAAIRTLRRMLTDGGFGHAYDLQTSKRSSWYFHLFPPKQRPAWSGIAYGCAFPDRHPNRNRLHDAVRQEQQLRQAGITEFALPDLSWMHGDIARFGLPSRFAILVPGSSPDRPRKRWPIACYGELAAALAGRGIASVVIGGPAEKDLAGGISGAIDLIGQTSFADLAGLARAAEFAVGNDTGPMHLIASAGCPSVTLFSSDSDPSHDSPVGRWTRTLQRPSLADLPAGAVLESLPA
jgi:ADP-heptose:LPS heptosyltransferase